MSPILAELMLMAATLVAGAEVGSFGFQLVGSSTHPAEVAARVISCQAQGLNETCTLALTNLGSSNVETSSFCALGQARGRLISGGTIPAGESLGDVDCSVTGAAAPKSSTVTGWVVLSNGADVYFAGSS